MKAKTVYVADDGAMFNEQTDCQRYEALLGNIKRIMDQLPHIHPLGATYIQHDVDLLRRVKRELFALVLEQHGDSWPEWKAFSPDAVHPRSIVGRVLDDCGGPLAKAWATLGFYDFDTGREYSQPYYAMNPKETVEA